MHVFDIVKQFSKRNPFFVIIYLLLLLVLPIQDIILPHFYGKLIQAINLNGKMFGIVVTIIVLIVILQVAIFISDYVEMQLYPRLTIFIRKYMLESIVRSSSTNYADIRSGSVMSQIVRMPSYTYHYINQLKAFIIPQFVVMICAGIYFAYNDMLLGMTFLAVTFVFIVITCYTPASCNDISVHRERTVTKIVERMDDILKNLISVLNANRMSKEYKTIDTMNDTYTRQSLDTLFCSSRFKIMLIPIQIVYFVFFVYRCFILVKSHLITTAQFVSLFIIILYVSNSMWRITGTLTDLTYQSGVINSALSNIDTTVMNPETVVSTNTTLLSSKQNSIVFEKVTLVYGDKIAVNNLSLSIPDQQKIAIVGNIGSGKSSIIKLLMRFYIPISGEIYYDSVAYSTISVQEIRENIGYIPQNAVLFDRSIYENIVYGHEDVSIDRVRTMIHSLGLVDIFPLGLDSPVGKNGSLLSGGERQIVLILRILLQNPKVLLLDESTASMDKKTKHHVFTLLAQAMKGKTVIMVTHDDDMLRYANRVVTMEHGQIIQDRLKRV